MRSHIITLLAGLGAVAAHPGLFERQACNADNCLRAIRSSTTNGASADCSSFLARTVTSCGGTTTATSFTTTTQAAATAETLSTTTIRTSVTVSTVTVPSTSTVTSTTTRSAGTATTTSITTVTTTLAVSTVTTTTSLSTIPPGPGGPEPNKMKRQAGCTPTTVTPSSLPSYASGGCALNTARYSSACRCIGVATGPTTTVGVAAVTVTSTSTITTQSPTVTTTRTISTTTTNLVTAISTSTVLTTSVSTSISGASTTVTVTSTTTSTTSTGTTTVTATIQPTSNTFKLILPGGRQLGIDPSNNSLLPVENGGTGATFQLNQFGYLVSSTLTFGTRAVTGLDTVFGFGTTPAFPARCTLSNPPTGGNLVCRVSQAERFFSLCNNRVVLGTSFQPAPCAQIDLFAA